jgi:uncharacterized protein DUF2188
MPARTVFEILPTGGAWRIRHEGSAVPIAELRTREVAIDLACDLARRESPAEVVLLALTGQVLKHWSFVEARIVQL